MIRSIEIPDALWPEVVQAICARQAGNQQWTAEVENPDKPGTVMANPVTPEDLVDCVCLTLCLEERQAWLNDQKQAKAQEELQAQKTAAVDATPALATAKRIKAEREERLRKAKEDAANAEVAEPNP